MKLLECHCIVGREERAKNIANAMALDLPLCTPQPERKGRIAIVGSGPSVSDYLDEIRSFEGEVWALNGAYDYLIGHDIIPFGMVMVDPHPILTKFLRNIDKRTTLYLASVCAPEVFDAVSDCDVWVWHSKMDKELSPAVGGGISCMTCAPYLAHMIGWRDIVIYGADSSYVDQPYVYDSGGKMCSENDQLIHVRVGNDVFKTELGLAHQANQMCVINDNFPGSLEFRCDGLMRALLDSQVHDVREFAA